LRGDKGGIKEQWLGKWEDYKDWSHNNNKWRRRNWRTKLQLGLVLLFFTFTQCFGFG
jgi:hypothetical protein